MVRSSEKGKREPEMKNGEVLDGVLWAYLRFGGFCVPSLLQLNLLSNLSVFKNENLKSTNQNTQNVPHDETVIK